MAFDFTSLDAVPSTFASIPPDTLLTREKAALALTACGVPISRRTLATRACRGGGPPYRHFGRVVLYEWQDLVGWACGKMSPSASNASEHRAGGSSRARHEAT
jgi:hypothetical protein